MCSSLERDVDMAVAEMSCFFGNILIVSLGDTSCDTSHSISLASEGCGISYGAFVEKYEPNYDDVIVINIMFQKAHIYLANSDKIKSIINDKKTILTNDVKSS